MRLITDAPPPYVKPGLSEDKLAVARQRAQHVIVLMLENRSFDHLFGFLDHPKIKNLEPGDYPNPIDLDRVTASDGDNAVEPIGVSPTATPRLEFDPPHGHLSAKTQLNADLRGRFRMNGFVTAYAQKLAGRADIPVVNWGRVRLLAVPLALVLSASFHDLARRAVAGGWASWGRLIGLAAVAAVIVYVATAALRISAIPGLSRSRKLLGIGVVAFVIAAAVAGWWRWLTVASRGVWSWPIATYVLLNAAIAFAKKELRARSRLPRRALREQSKKIMSCMPRSAIPVLGALATRYATCTAWHSSVPGATWPNRNFAHAATSDESVDIEVGFYDDRTIFELLDEEHGGTKGGRETWRIYHHDIPQVIAFHRLWEGDRIHRWYDADKLFKHIAEDALPMYSFVEPCHAGRMTNSQHPVNNESADAEDFVRGEALIASIYNALAARPDVFEKTVFVVTYDEHGGLFDHVPPPRTVHPEPDRAVRSRELARRFVALFIEHINRPFDFGHLGMRVPAVVISPWVTPGEPDATVYDHASIVATLRRLFAPNKKPLSRRDEHANDFLHLLVNTEKPAGPIRLEPTPFGEEVACVPASELKVDAAAAGVPEEVVLQRDDLADQLDKLSHLVRRRMEETALPPEEAPPAPPAPPPPPGPPRQTVDGLPNLDPALPSMTPEELANVMRSLPSEAEPPGATPTAELFKRRAAVDRPS